MTRLARRRWTCTICNTTEVALDPARALRAHYLAHHQQPPPF